MSSLDKRITNAWYEIEIEPSTQLPVSIKMVVLAGQRAETETDKKKNITGGKHVAFHFRYSLSDYGKVKIPAVPPDAKKLLAKG